MADERKALRVGRAVLELLAALGDALEGEAEATTPKASVKVDDLARHRARTALAKLGVHAPRSDR